MFMKHQAPNSPPTLHNPTSQAQHTVTSPSSPKQAVFTSMPLEEGAGVVRRVAQGLKSTCFLVNDEKERNMFKY